MSKFNERKWIEFGKMWEKMANHNDFSFGVTFHPVRYKHEGIDYNKTPYDTLKQIYFEKYLGILDSEVLELDVETEVLELLYQLADKKDISVDELIIEIVSNFIEEKE